MVAVNYGLNQSRVFIGVLAGPRKRLHVLGVWNLCMGARLCPFRETESAARRQLPHFSVVPADLGSA